MLTISSMTLRHSNSMTSLYIPDSFKNSKNTCTAQRSRLLQLSMGPVSAAVVMYIAERAVTRIANGQLMRRGIIRKIRRLGSMVLEWHMLLEVVYDLLEDMQ
jgi:hypothetical protein